MKIRYTPRARNDLQAIIEYLRSKNPQGARNVKRAFDATAQLIEHFPDCGRLVNEEGVRVLPVGRYPLLDLLDHRG